MQYILTQQLLGGKYSKWIVILQELDLEFKSSKSMKSLVYAQLLCDLSYTHTKMVAKDSMLDEFILFISSSNPWYVDIIV